MIDIGHALAFALVAFGIIAAPGPSVLFVVSRGVAYGRQAAMASAVGNNAGLFVQAVLVAFGLGALLERSVIILTLVKLLGAGYLIYLGLRAIYHRRALTATFGAATAAPNVARMMREGFLVGVSNPKATILLAAILPQFADPARGHMPLQLFSFGLIAVVIAMVSDNIWGFFAGTARVWLGRSSRRLEVMGWAGGLIMIGLGLRLVLTGRSD